MSGDLAKVKPLFGRMLVAMEARPRHDLMKLDTTESGKRPALEALREALESLADACDNIVVDNASFFVEVAEQAASFLIDGAQKHVSDVAPYMKGSVAGTSWREGFDQSADGAASRIMDHAKATLLTLKPDEFEGRMSALVKVRHAPSVYILLQGSPVVWV